MGLISDIFRGFCEPEDRDSTGTNGGLRIVPVFTAPAVTSVPTVRRPANSPDWQKLFGHIERASIFNESNFPLEPNDQLREVMAHEFPDMDRYKEDQTKWAHNHGMELALPRATGLCLMANPGLVTDHRRVISVGAWAQREPALHNPYDSHDSYAMSVFFRKNGQLHVEFKGHQVYIDRTSTFLPSDVWLFSRKSEA